MTNVPPSAGARIARRDLLALGAGAAVLGAMAKSGPAAASGARVGPPAMPEPSTDQVQVERVEDGVLLIGLNRPDAQNRVTVDMFLALAAAYHRLEADDGLRVGVLYAQGPDFCVGLDTQDWGAKLATGRFTLDPERRLNPVATAGALRTKPIVVAVQGRTWMLGHELFLAADIRVAARDVRFNQAEVTKGLFPGGGGALRFTREAGRGNAMRYMLTGEEWGAEEADRWGLVQALTEPGRQLDAAMAFAREIATKAAPLGTRALLSNLNKARLEGEQAAYVALLPQFGQLFRTEDFRERVRAANENREPVYRGR
jgi:enoyl-CoA hydratase/carnithine racemase